MTRTKKISTDTYQVPASEVAAVIKVKGSKFIASIFPAATAEEAEEIYDKIKKKFFNATHNCLAYRINDTIFRYSDDGEPSGTAGKPMLQALDGAGLSQVVCVVTRYFGGTKLGTGGLIRAYSDSVSEAIKALKIKTKTKTASLRLGFKYEQENLIRRHLAQAEGTIIHSDYSADVVFDVAIPRSKVADFTAQVSEATQSTTQITKI